MPRDGLGGRASGGILPIPQGGRRRAAGAVRHDDGGALDPRLAAPVARACELRRPFARGGRAGDFELIDDGMRQVFYRDVASIPLNLSGGRDALGNGNRREGATAGRQLEQREATAARAVREEVPLAVIAAERKVHPGLFVGRGRTFRVLENCYRTVTTVPT